MHVGYHRVGRHTHLVVTAIIPIIRNTVVFGLLSMYCRIRSQECEAGWVLASAASELLANPDRMQALGSETGLGAMPSIRFDSAAAFQNASLQMFVPRTVSSVPAARGILIAS